MKKQYIMPQTEAQHITTGQIICTSLNPTIQKGNSVPVVPGEGKYV